MTDFEKIDHSLTSFGLDNETKTGIYKVLAAILHLGNTEFVDAGDDASAISEHSIASCDHAAHLLSIEAQALQTSFLKKNIKIMESEILWVILIYIKLLTLIQDEFYGIMFDCISASISVRNYQKRRETILSRDSMDSYSKTSYKLLTMQLISTPLMHSFVC